MARRIAAVLVFLVALLCGCKANTGPSAGSAAPNTASKHADERAAASGFDYYLLNLSWSPEFCYSHPNAVECAAHARFVLHGLWPQNNDGTYPENCSSAPGPADAAEFRDIYPDSGLLVHEWRTHGTCSGLSADQFFAQARQAYESVKIPPMLSNLDRQVSMPPGEILGLFAQANPGLKSESLALSCGNNFLTAVEVCLDKSLHPIACGPIRSCRASVVRIPPPR